MRPYEFPITIVRANGERRDLGPCLLTRVEAGGGFDNGKAGLPTALVTIWIRVPSGQRFRLTVGPACFAQTRYERRNAMDEPFVWWDVEIVLPCPAIWRVNTDREETVVLERTNSSPSSRSDALTSKK